MDPQFFPVSLLAQSVLAQQSGSSTITNLLFIPLMIAMVLVLFVPQRRQRKRQQELLASLDVGDEVVTNAGIYGVVTNIEDGVVHLEIDTDVVIKVSKSAVTTRITASTESPGEDA